MELEEKGKKFSVMKAETSQITENIEMGMTETRQTKVMDVSQG